MPQKLASTSEGAAINYYEHHIGDYAQATAHLSFIEDAAYSRLIRKYYAEEKPLPADLKAVQRLVGARTKEERQAVSDILDEFFELEDDGWHNKRCDAEITRYRGKQDKARASAEARWSKRNANAMRTHAETDADAMRTHEHVSSENKKKSSEQHDPEKNKFSGDAASREEKPNKSTGDAMRTQCERNAHQSPVTKHQTPDLKNTTTVSNVVDYQPGAREGPGENATRKGMLCKRLRSLGIDAAPHLQGWAELLPAYSDAEILAAAEQAREKKPGERLHLNYLLHILRDRAVPTPARNGQPEKFDPVAYVNRNRISNQRAYHDNANPFGNIIEHESK